ncbi:MAG TPA: vanadium-dependent haloperoxidase [Chitinophagaceae bacterium]
MKPIIIKPTAKWLMLLGLSLFTIISCQKERSSNTQQEELSATNNSNRERGHLKQTKEYSSDVVQRWLNMELQMLRVPMDIGVSAPEAFRAIAYCGIALYEAVEPGMPAYQAISGQLNALPSIKSTLGNDYPQPGYAYHWGASANAALAYMNRSLFPGASAANKTAMNDLEKELEESFALETDAATLQRSIAFGRAVAEIIFNWAKTDGTSTLPTPSTYSIPTGDGLWEKTPPKLAGPVNPFASQRRLLVNGSGDGTQLAPPPAYDVSSSSDFYAMVKDVYDRSLTLTHADSATAIYHRDAPGYPGGGSLVAMLLQAFQQSGCKLDAAALAYAKLGLGTYDATIIGFVKKYQVNLVRPITYIRAKMQHPLWNALFATPGHPEFPSAHAWNGGVVSVMLTSVLGENFNLTLDHYNYQPLQLPARHYNSFDELGKEMGDSRVLAGIHYQASCDKGFWLGKKISNNILSKVKFLKE